MVFGVDQFNGVVYLFPTNPVDMATKFRSQLAITRLV